MATATPAVVVPEGESTLNFNAAECIKTESDFINTKYHNICSGEVHVVPTGVYDYMIGIPFMLLIAVGATLAVGWLLSIVGEWWDDRKWRKEVKERARRFDTD